MKTTRRQFLQKTAGTAGALAVSRKVMIEGEHLPSALNTLTPASDRLRFGMIGVGMQGSSLLAGAITLPGVECVAAADLYDGRHTLSNEIVGKKIFTTRKYQELLCHRLANVTSAFRNRCPCRHSPRPPLLACASDLALPR